MTCQVCFKEFPVAVEDRCPGCGTIVPLMKETDEIYLFMNWAQLRLISMVAARHAETQLMNEPDLLIALRRAFDRIRSFGAGRPLTVADDMRVARTTAENRGESRPVFYGGDGKKLDEPLL